MPTDGQQWKNLKAKGRTDVDFLFIQYIAAMYLIGASGHAKVVIDNALSAGMAVDGLYDKDENITSLMGYEVFPEAKLKYSDEIIIAVGDNQIRRLIANRYSNQKYISCIHASSILADSVRIGKGTAVMPGVIINADTTIGHHVILNTSASIDHDCKIEDFVHVAPNATLCGGVLVAEGSFIGAGAVVIPGVKIGKWCRVGAGAVVIRNVKDGETVVGNPARKIGEI